MANASTVVGSPILPATLPASGICLVRGFLLDSQSRPLSGRTLTVRRSSYSAMNTSTLDIVLRTPVRARTDANGYVEFGLIQGSRVAVSLPGMALDLPPTALLVPATATVDLMSFLFPHLVSIDWLDPADILLGLGKSISTPLVGTLVNGDTLPMPYSSVTLTSSNTNVLADRTGFLFYGGAIGTSTLLVSAVDATKLSTNQDINGNALVFAGLPAVILPATTVLVTVA